MWLFDRFREARDWLVGLFIRSAAVRAQTAFLLDYAECAAAIETRAKELDAQGLHEQANELRRQLQGISPQTVQALLSPAEPTPNGKPDAPALPSPEKKPGRPRKEQTNENLAP